MDTPAYISQLLSKHQLAPHPEGGYFRHTYTSSELMSDGRASMSSILFMLCDDNPTKFMHRNTRSDTIHMWHSGGSMRCVLPSRPGYCIQCLHRFADIGSWILLAVL